MHPCCGKDLRSATKLAAVIDIVWTSIFVALGIVIIITSATSLRVEKNEQSESPEDTTFAMGGLIVGTILLVVKILQLILAIFLLQGAMERNHYKCKIWIYITCVFVTITVMNFLFDVISVEGSKTGSVGSVIGIILHIYFLWIVWAYKKELEQGLAQPEADAGGLKA
ncbi:hypothetical protein Ocin01_10074 [Orchesella cincta]|uniref:Uncharacterized protein n=1 Tax=Orchesella cincta TaxID=48709 RepID=A0A1D2MUW4_ORCCI|nr:hypothetical protein Ocin01_10074 [Orchesella cincta]